MRDLIEKNVFLNNIVRTVALGPYNRKVNKFIEKMAVIDSIAQFEQFKDTIQEFENLYSGGIFSIKKSYSESLLYGHIHEMFAYANLDKKDYMYFPIMEHGVHYGMDLKKNQPPRIFQGDYFLEDWRKTYKGFPLYVVGPYIHYARDYYTDNQFEQMKKKLGKTLLVFPSHTYELCESTYNAEEFVEYVMNEHAKGYDSVIVCAYWADLEHEIYKRFSKKGAIIVSAGFRGDYNFIRRLKTIIKLSDSVVANALGTFLGYAIYLKKPVVLIDGNVVIDPKDAVLTAETADNMQRVEKHFMWAFSKDAEPFSEEQLSLCEKYWGLSRVKTPDEIKDILIVNKKIIQKSFGFLGRIAKASRKVYSNKLTKAQKNVLKEALVRKKV